MTVLELKQEIIRQSGRFDLVTNLTTYHDNGINFHILSGMRTLDNIQRSRNSVQQFKFVLSAGNYVMRIPAMRAFHNIYYINSEKTRVYLRKEEIEELKCMFPVAFDNPLPNDSSSVIRGNRPTHFAISNGAVNISTVDVTEDLEEREAVNVPQDIANPTVTILPPTTQDITVTVTGLFSISIDVNDDNATNYWSVNYPHILVMAVLYNIEQFRRNFEGARDYRSALQEMFVEIEHDMIEEESFTYNQLEG